MTPPSLRPLSVGEILDVSFALYRRHFGPLAAIAVACSAAPFLVGLYLAASGGALLNPPLLLLYLLLLVMLGTVATAATVFIVSESYLGRSLSAGEAVRRAVPLLGRLFAASLLCFMLVALGFVFLFVPGVVVGCGLLLFIPALVLEPGATARGALARSWRLTRGARWRMFALLLTLAILLYIPVAGVQGVLALLMGAPLTRVATGAGLLIPVAGGVVQMLAYPFFYCVLVVAYYDLRVRKEGFDLEVLASTLRLA